MTTSEDQQKKQLVIDAIAAHCAASSSSSQHEMNTLQRINDALSTGGTLEATTLSGGLTNFSYKVNIREQPKLCLFAKLSFEYALYNPGVHHDLARTENEFEVMKEMSAEAHGCVVAPLACLDADYEAEEGKTQYAKILVTEWSSADEQFGNQFADGCVDDRIAPQLADTLAKLHLKEEYSPDFNETVKPCFVGLLQMAKGVVEGLCDKEDEPKDRTEQYCKEVGSVVLSKVMQANIDNFDRRDCLIHGDSHVFNMLVEAKPSIEHLEDFGPNGTLVLCDWETCMAGPVGKDIGAALAGPIGCLVGHALNDGRIEPSIQGYVDTLLQVYLNRMSDGGKTDEERAYMIRNAAGWIGWTQFVVFYFLGVQLDAFGVEDEELKRYVRDAMGALGLKLMRFSYDEESIPASMNADEMLEKFTALYKEEVDRAISDFASRKRKMQPRKSSILRRTSRRVSDAALHLLATDSVARELSGCSIAE